MAFFNKKIKIDWYTFESIAEGKYYTQLKYEKMAKTDLLSFEVKPKFVLQEKPRVTFTPDFIETRANPNGQIQRIIVDVKAKNGYQTEGFKIKWKWLQGIMKDQNNVHFRIVKL